jgi:hypothetical protein
VPVPNPPIMYPPGVTPSCSLTIPTPSATLDDISAVSTPSLPTYAALDPEPPRSI